MFFIPLLLMSQHVSIILGQTYYTCADWMSNHENNSLTDGVYNITLTFQRSDSYYNNEDLYFKRYCKSMPYDKKVVMFSDTD